MNKWWKIAILGVGEEEEEEFAMIKWRIYSKHHVVDFANRDVRENYGKKVKTIKIEDYSYR